MNAPPGTLFPEPYIDATLATLRAELPGSILAQNAYYEDFELPTPDPTTGYVWGVETAFQPPMVEVGVPDETVENFDIEQLGADAAIVLIVRAWLAIDESINSAEKLARANYRMGRALTNVLLVRNAFGMNTPVRTLRASWRVNPETREGEAVTGSTLLVFELEGFESR